jgi:hypothetical protein
MSGEPTGRGNPRRCCIDESGKSEANVVVGFAAARAEYFAIILGVVCCWHSNQRIPMLTNASTPAPRPHGAILAHYWGLICSHYHAPTTVSTPRAAMCVASFELRQMLNYY